MFKRYDDVSHYGVFIPIGFKKWKHDLFDISTDGLKPPAYYRLHFCVAIKVFSMPSARFKEIRIRVGLQYL